MKTATDLWQRLSAYEFDRAGISLSFAARLARENRWTDEHAERVMFEYKRFCYLAVTGDSDVTPSDAVDQAWHLHLTYSRDYWEEFCPNILGVDLHHGPTAGGQVERVRYYDQYAATLRSYEVAFDEPPPPDIWPDAKRRFHTDPQGQRVNPADVIILDKQNAALGALAWVALGMVVAALLGVLF